MYRGLLNAPGAMASKSGEAKILPDLTAEVRGLAIGVTEWCAPPAIAAVFHRLREGGERTRWIVRVFIANLP